MSNMPHIENFPDFLIKFSPENQEIIKNITNRGKGQIRASKPKNGDSAYVWRMVVFYVSPISAHHCMPMMAYNGIDIKNAEGKLDYKSIQKRCRELDILVNEITNIICCSSVGKCSRML